MAANASEKPADKWATNALLAQLRPPPDCELQAAVFASYSADLRVVAAVLLALAGKSQDPDRSSRVHFVQAIRRLVRRVAFVVQRGRLHRPSRLHNIAGLLDRFVFEAPCDEGRGGRSWHPKLALISWQHITTKERSWRLWLGSRNLTRDLSRDVGLLLTPGDRALSATSKRALVDAVGRLQEWLPADRSGRPFEALDLQSLAHAKWALPPGVADIELAWLAGQEAFPNPAEPLDEALVISPFIDKSSIDRAVEWMKGGRRPSVLASMSDLAMHFPEYRADGTPVDLRVMSDAPDGGFAYEPPLGAPSSLDEQESAEQEVDRSDEAELIHAKLIYQRRGARGRLWLGSPNFTRRGWHGNFEFATRMEVHGANHPWAQTIRDLIASAVQYESRATTVPVSAVADLVEETRSWISAHFQPIQRRHDDGVRLETKIALEIRHPAMVLKLSSPWTETADATWPAGASHVDLAPLALELQGEFLRFTLSCEGVLASWLMRVPFEPPLEQARDHAVLLAYLGPRGFLDLVASELGAGAPERSPPWDTPDVFGATLATAAGGKRKSALTLEALLKLRLRDPDQFRWVAQTVEAFLVDEASWQGALSSDVALAGEVEEFRTLWSSIGRYLAGAKV